jgi:hypothetical protein
MPFHNSFRFAISRQLTTGALAIAGSVAAFGFAGAAPVQAQEECLPQSFNIRPLAKVLSRSLYSNIFEDYQLLINN